MGFSIPQASQAVDFLSSGARGTLRGLSRSCSILTGTGVKETDMGNGRADVSAAEPRRNGSVSQGPRDACNGRP